MELIAAPPNSPTPNAVFITIMWTTGRHKRQQPTNEPLHSPANHLLFHLLSFHVSICSASKSNHQNSNNESMQQQKKHKHRFHLNSLWSIWYGILATYLQGYLVLHGAYRFLGEFRNFKCIKMFTVGRTTERATPPQRYTTFGWAICIWPRCAGPPMRTHPMRIRIIII